MFIFVTVHVYLVNLVSTDLISAPFTIATLNLVFSKQISYSIVREYIQFEAMLLLEAGLVKAESFHLVIALANHVNLVHDWDALSYA